MYYIPDHVFNNKKISLKAKALYAFIYDYSEKNYLSIQFISSQLKEGKDSTQAGIKELKKAGYLEVVKTKEGYCEYLIKSGKTK